MPTAILTFFSRLTVRVSLQRMQAMDVRPDHEFARDSMADATADSADDANRRKHVRKVRVMRVARLQNQHLDAEGLGMVRDVSPGGMMIDAHFELEIGQTVAIALFDDQELTGEIVWKDGQTVGVRFDRPVPVEQILAKPATNQDGRRPRLPRLTVRKAAQLVVNEKLVAAIICDVSQRGAKLQCESRLGMHSNILIRLGRHRPVRATVKWRGGEFTGVEFHRLLAVDELVRWLQSDNLE